MPVQGEVTCGGGEPRNRVPAGHELAERLDAVLTVLHLPLTTGLTAPTGDLVHRVDLVDRAVGLTRILLELCTRLPRAWPPPTGPRWPAYEQALARCDEAESSYLRRRLAQVRTAQDGR